MYIHYVYEYVYICTLYIVKIFHYTYSEKTIGMFTLTSQYYVGRIKSDIFFSFFAFLMYNLSMLYIIFS